MKLKASYHQERLWVINEFEKGQTEHGFQTPYFNMPVILEITGALKYDILQASLDALVQKHDILRTSIVTYQNRPYQEISSNSSVKITEDKWQDAIHYPSILNYLVEYSQQPFKPTETFKGKLLGIGANVHMLCLVFHHSIMDPYAVKCIVSQLFENYENLSTGKKTEREDSGIPFADYSEWQYSFPEDYLKSLEIFWTNRVGGVVPVSDLPANRTAALTSSAYQPGRLQAKLDSKLAAAADKYASAMGKEVEVVFLTAFQLLLRMHSANDEVIAGVLLDGRSMSGFGGIMGPLSQVMPLKADFSIYRTLPQAISHTAVSLEQNKAHEYFPYELLISRLELGLKMGRNALFNNLFHFNRRPIIGEISGDLKIKYYETNLGLGKYDLNMLVQECDGGYSINLVYNSELFEKSTIERLIDEYEVLLQSICVEKAENLEELSFLSADVQQELLYKYNQTEAGYPETTLHALFADSARRFGARPAVSFEGLEISYSALDRKSNKIAHVLRNSGVKTGDFVGVLLNRSIDMITALLGIIKAGGAYVPVDPLYPEERIKFILDDCGTGILVSSAEINAGAYFSGKIIDVECEAVVVADETMPDVEVSGADPAYVVYTSGTTGIPKGVIVSHTNVIRLLINDHFPYQFAVDDVWVLFHSYCFDVSVWEMYGALLFGSKLIVVSNLIAKDTQLFLSLLETESVTILNQTPSAFYNLSAAALSKAAFSNRLRYIFFAGENLIPAKLDKWNLAFPEIKLINMYGITEITVHATLKEISRTEIEKNISNIGVPLPATTCYVFDENKKLVPVGVPGELYVGGSGVTMGYLNRPELTRERFITNPYIPDETIYKSGDLVKRLPDGDLVFLGRLDKQVQIRGFRVELGEVEAQLLEHPDIKEAVVIAYTDDALDNELCAYIVSDVDFSAVGLKNFLQKFLPAYMIPAFYIPLPQLPLTSNGKLDVKSLPEPRAHKLQTTVTYVPARTLVEEQIVNIWQDVLKLPKIGIDESFFELGGNSLKAVVLLSRIQDMTGYTILLSQLFSFPTVRGLSENLQQFKLERLPPIVKVNDDNAFYPVSSVQKRLLIINTFANVATTYNIYRVYEIASSFNLERLENAFRQLITRHEVFRTSFEFQSNIPVQRIHPVVDFTIDRITATDEDILDIAKKYIRPFDLSKAPLLRVACVTINQDSFLIIDVHHIIADGITMTIIEKEVNAYYSGDELPAQRYQYKDFSEWQNSLLSLGNLNGQKQYWSNKLSGELPLLELPTDFVRPPYMNFEGDLFQFKAGKDLAEKIKGLTIAFNCTEYMVLLSALYILCHKYTEQDDIIIGCTASGRNHEEVNNIAGCFLNMLPMRVRLSANISFSDFLLSVKEECAASFDNQEYPFELVVDNVKSKRDVSRNPIFDIIFVYQNFSDLADRQQEKVIIPKPYNSRTSKYDLSLYAKMTNSEIYFEFEYYEPIFRPSTIQQMAVHFLNILESIAGAPDIAIRDIALSDMAENDRLTKALNNTQAKYEQKALIHELFQRQAKIRPDSIALISSAGLINYRELNSRSNQIALYLIRNQSVKPNDLVGIYMGRSIETIIAILGVLKSGAAYVPLDPELPSARLTYMINSSGIKTVIAEPRYRAVFQQVLADCEILSALIWVKVPGEPFLLPNEENGVIADIDHEFVFQDKYVEDFSTDTTSEDLAYIIHTSGTTGVPKGVAVQHFPVINLIEWVNKTFNVSDADRLLFVTSFSFDLSVYDMFGLLAAGGSIFITHADELRDPDKLVKLLTEKQITFWDSAPAALQQLVPTIEKLTLPNSSLRLFFMSGDWIPVKIPGILNKHFDNCQVVSLGGATEATVWSNYYLINEVEPNTKSIPYGRPIQNARYYILDSSFNPCPVGVPGNLYIAGDCLAKGYFNDTELSDKKFIADPFYPGQKMYNTGDISRWMADDNIEFLGRKDSQVKIRGYRIEKGEIESHLLEWDNVKEVIVLDRVNKSNEKYLCAYILTDGYCDPIKIRAFLSSRIPAYMIPSHFVALREFPMTVNGKIDRGALPDPIVLQNNMTTEVSFKPGNGMEKLVAELWREELELTNFNYTENFFELGGNSLQVIKIINKLSEQLSRNISIVSFFQYPTIEAFAGFLMGDTGSPAASKTRTREVLEGKDTMKKSLERALKRKS